MRVWFITETPVGYCELGFIFNMVEVKQLQVTVVSDTSIAPNYEPPIADFQSLIISD